MLDKGTKIIIGAVVTSLMAWGAHSGFGTGGGFVDRLETRAQAALTGGSFSGVNLEMGRDPTLSRTIILSGDESQKEAAMAAMRDVPGVGIVKWAGDEASGETAASGDIKPAEAPASAEAVANCQGGIDTLMQGKTINFKSGSAYLAADSNAVVDELAKALTPCAGTNVEVQGHTDLTGNAGNNQALSQERADRVMKALAAKGVPADRLTAKGYGSSQPLENAMTRAANAKNRRTVFIVSAAGAAAAEEGE
ncbi:MAG: OmpA family protein [Sphingorhabdus sp.]